MYLDKIYKAFIIVLHRITFLQYIITRKLEIWMTLTSTWEILQIRRIELVLIPKFNSQSSVWDLIVIGLAHHMPHCLFWKLVCAISAAPAYICKLKLSELHCIITSLILSKSPGCLERVIIFAFLVDHF